MMREGILEKKDFLMILRLELQDWLFAVPGSVAITCGSSERDGMAAA
jgi:hypothetical protein